MTPRRLHLGLAWIKLLMVIAVTASITVTLPPARSAQRPAEASKNAAASPTNVEKERAQFRSLILGNPNYFGTLPESKLKPVLVINSNTTYEEIGCVGYH